jgi:phosphoribosylanthranilate isomerase
MVGPRVKVKICGITNLEDALASLFSGADALGFVFYKKSPRYIEPVKAAGISRILPKHIARVGVFVNEAPQKVRKIAQLCRLDMLQFHGQESPQYCSKFKGYKVIKAFRIKDRVDVKGLSRYKVYACLLDTFIKARPGGTGKKFDWNLIGKTDKIKKRLFLSGGLNQRNVRSAIKKIKPDWVDVSSSVEAKAGKKDHNKIICFIKRCQQCQ